MADVEVRSRGRRGGETEGGEVPRAEPEIARAEEREVS